MKIIAVSMFLCVNFVASFAQSSYSGGLSSEFKPSVSLKNNWKLNSKFSTRIYFFEGPTSRDFHKKVYLERTEMELILNKKLSTPHSYGVGYLLRNEEGSIKQRLIQQFSTSKDYRTVSLGHRFRLDETFEKDKSILYRFRYRINLEKPLNWKIKENREVSLLLNNEYLPSLQKRTYETEVRVFAGLGYKANENNEFQVGIDYRIESLFTSSYKQIYLLSIGWTPNF